MILWIMDSTLMIKSVMCVSFLPSSPGGTCTQKLQLCAQIHVMFHNIRTQAMIPQTSVSHVTQENLMILVSCQISIRFRQSTEFSKIKSYTISYSCPVPPDRSRGQHRVNPRMRTHPPVQGVILSSNPCVPKLHSQRRLRHLNPSDWG